MTTSVVVACYLADQSATNAYLFYRLSSIVLPTFINDFYCLNLPDANVFMSYLLFMSILFLILL